MIQKTIALFFLGLLVFFVAPAIAQTVDQQDLSTVKVDDLSDAQVKQFMNKAAASGMGDAQLEQMAIAQGMPTTEVAKLRLRVEKIKKQETTAVTTNDKDKQVYVKTDDSTTQEIIKKNTRIFGASLFSKANLTFEPNLRIATPVDYQLGPDDEILIDIYGYSEANYNLTVSPEGTINIPIVGIVAVGGATIEQATSRIRSRMTAFYPDIKNGNTKLGITLGNIRSIKVVLTGEIEKPGTYTLPSVANVFNALYASGGPNDNGSYRQVQVIRGSETIAVLDIYDFLLYGSLKNNIRLQDMDVIRIPAYKTRVEVSGEVKRPAIFEMKYNETLGDLIRFTGGFTENAYKARIKVLKNTATEHAIQDVAADQFETYVPATGDKFFVDKILDRYTNRITINGAVFRPGEYELTEGLTLKQLIQKADGLKEDVFPNRGYINRLKDNLTREMVSFNTKDIMSGAAEDIALKREDIVNIPSIFDLKEEYNIVVIGEVRNPTTFPFADNMSLDDAIIMAGGFNDGATGKRIEVARRIKNSKTETDTTTTAQLFTINIDKDLKNASNFELKPFDIISVFPAPGYVVQRTVIIEGEVLYPGTYTISNKNERISDLIKRAGGLTKSAYREGATLKRERKDKTQLEKEQEGINIKKYKTLRSKADSTEENDENFTNEIIRNNFIGIDLGRILKKPGRQYDLLLSDGDIISIPKELQTVRVSGEVLSPSAVVFDRGAKFKAYVLRSGGFTADAYRKRSYITYANGSVEGTKTFLFFRKYPRVKPGAEIFIPLKKKDRGKLSATEIVAFTTAITTVATLVYTVFKAK